MPGKDGYETTTEILEILKLNNLETFICACSAFDGVDEKKEQKKWG